MGTYTIKAVCLDKNGRVRGRIEESYLHEDADDVCINEVLDVKDDDSGDTDDDDADCIGYEDGVMDRVYRKAAMLNEFSKLMKERIAEEKNREKCGGHTKESPCCGNEADEDITRCCDHGMQCGSLSNKDCADCENCEGSLCMSLGGGDNEGRDSWTEDVGFGHEDGAPFHRFCYASAEIRYLGKGHYGVRMPWEDRYAVMSHSGVLYYFPFDGGTSIALASAQASSKLNRDYIRYREKYGELD